MCKIKKTLPYFSNTTAMIKVYVMSTCPDCVTIKQTLANDTRYKLIDLGEHAHNLKEFLQLRDTHPKFETARKRGLIGIPSFLLSDGTVTFKPEEAGLAAEKEDCEMGQACNLDGSGC